MAFSVQVLCYGDYTALAEQCLGSIEQHLAYAARGVVQDVRVGLNEVSRSTLEYCRSWADRVSGSFQLPVLLYCMPRNACKYPVMRKMFRNPDYRLPDWVMWFDDDSRLTGTDPRFFNTWDRVCRETDASTVMIGEDDWERALQGNQAKYFASKSWFAGVSWGGRRSARHTPFVTGGWWILRKSVIVRYDWPDPELRHNGGDQMLGVLLRQQGLRTRCSDFTTVAVNADEMGRRSKAKRRGFRESLIGANWHPGTKIDTRTFHNFAFTIEQYPREGSSSQSVQYPRLSGLV